jgi:acetate kinase
MNSANSFVDSRHAKTAEAISTDANRAMVRVIRTDEAPTIARSVYGIPETDAGNGQDLS